MSNFTTHVSDSAFSVTPNHFLQQLKRLESLQILMTQGSTVVNDVVEFMAKARAEVDMLRKEQEAAARYQESTQFEANAMRTRIQELETLLVSSDVRAKEQDLVIGRLRSDLAAAASLPSTDELTALNTKIGSLERQLAAEHERRVRLMQVLRTHEVTVMPKVASAMVTPEKVG